MIQKLKENKRLLLAVILAAAVLLAAVILLCVLLGGEEDGGWGLASRPGSEYGDWSFDVDENGETVFPTDPAGAPIFPTDGEGDIIIPTDESGEAILPTDDDGEDIYPTDPDTGETIRPTEKDDGDENSTPSGTGPEITIPPDATVEVKNPEEFVEPGPGTLNVSGITGFTPVQLDQSGKKNEDGSDFHGPGDRGHAGITLTDPDLVLEYVGTYNGSFIEDGSDEMVQGCLGIILTNNSEDTLQIASVTLLVNEDEEATFLVSNLAPGTSTMVLEESRREYEKGDSFTLGDMASGYLEEASLMEDKFRITGENGKIIVTNLTDESYEKIYVYYKFVQLGGAYLGGITYRVPVENLGPGETVEVTAGHWREGSSRLSMVEIVE